MTFYIRLAFTSRLALRIKGAAYFTKSKRSETDNKLREVRGQVQVLVKWMGFDEDENTWEPVTTILEDAPDLLREFLEITSSALASKVRAML
jgi:hypothetical protein